MGLVLHPVFLLSAYYCRCSIPESQVLLTGASDVPVADAFSFRVL